MSTAYGQSLADNNSAQSAEFFPKEAWRTGYSPYACAVVIFTGFHEEPAPGPFSGAPDT